MRAKQSTTALGTDRRLKALPTLLASCVASPSLAVEAALSLDGESTVHGPRCGAETARQEGVLHDARNLMGAIGLYCDLLSMPGVLQPEHRLYAEELRLLGARSEALIQHLMEQSMPFPEDAEGQQGAPGTGAAWEKGVVRSLNLDKALAEGDGVVESADCRHGPVSLRAIVERCRGLLSRVADGRAIKVIYGDAASTPVAVGEEAVERILLNLVGNSAAAMRGPRRPGEDGKGRAAAGTAAKAVGAIRIEVGVPVNLEQDPRPWPLRRVRLTVEDSGCGMTAEQLERIQSVTRSPLRGRHGIGFRVVRTLVASSRGDLRVTSVPCIGTRVQIEWPVTAMAQEDAAGRGLALRRTEASSRLAAASGSAVRARPGLQAPAMLGVVKEGTVTGPGGVLPAGDGRWRTC